MKSLNRGLARIGGVILSGWGLRNFPERRLETKGDMSQGRNQVLLHSKPFSYVAPQFTILQSVFAISNSFFRFR